MKAGSFYQNYREVTLLVVHCSATCCDRHFSVEALRRSHLARGFADIGYHFYITRDGEVHICRPVHQIGAHATGWNDKSIGINHFLDLAIGYKAKRWEFSVTANNLIGTSEFERRTLGNTIESYSITRLRPREVLAKLSRDL